MFLKWSVSNRNIFVSFLPTQITKDTCTVSLHKNKTLFISLLYMLIIISASFGPKDTPITGLYKLLILSFFESIFIYLILIAYLILFLNLKKFKNFFVDGVLSLRFIFH